MADQPTYPRVIFYEGFGERDAVEMEKKGWYPVHVELENGNRYELTFFDPGRLGQGLAHDIQLGHPCFAELNLIIVPIVTVEAIQASVQFLGRIGFFDDLKPERKTGQ